MPKKPRAKVGDLLRIPLDKETCGFGQIRELDKHQIVHLIIIYSMRARVDENLSPEGIVKSEALFIANTLDARITHGQWPIIGNSSPDIERFPLPNYVVKIGEQMNLINYHATLRRPASESELAIVPFRKTVAPIRLEKALKAHFGLGPWDSRYDELKAEVVLRSARVSLSLG